MEYAELADITRETGQTRTILIFTAVMRTATTTDAIQHILTVATNGKIRTKRKKDRAPRNYQPFIDA